MKEQSRKLLFFVIVTLFLFNIYLFSLSEQKNEPYLNFYLLDVGQGDAIYFRTPSGQDVLIDGGPDKKVLEELGKVMPFGDKKIEVMMLTHSHADHLKGLEKVAERYKVDTFLYGEFEETSSSLENILQRLRKQKTEVSKVKRGDKINLKDAELEILGPVKFSKKKNNISVFSQLKYKEIKFLLTGDAEEEEWDDIIKTQKDLKSDIMKSAHHGSRNGLNQDSLVKVDPEVSLISAGRKNKYNHPHNETLELLQKYGSKTRGTYEKGTMKVRTDGSTFSLSNP